MQWKCVMIYIDSVSKRIKGKTIIDRLSLSLPEGKITALVGKNGCGKTTLIRLISGVLTPDSGRIYSDCSNTIGVLFGGEVSLYNKLTGLENIEYFAKLRGLTAEQFAARCDDLAELLEFGGFMNQKTEGYSRGMKQKIAFAIAVIHDPQVLLLDEPSTGLDITTSIDVIKLINRSRNENKTVLISTHNIAEILHLSDRVAIMKNGNIKMCEDKATLFGEMNMESALTKLAAVI